MGFGEEKTPKAFVSACDRFIYTEVLQRKMDGSAEAPLSPKASTVLRGDTRLVSLIRDGLQASSDDAGWAPLSTVGGYINRTATDFDSRSYGYAKLSELVAAIGLFEVERRGQLVFVRDTRRKHTSNAA